MRTRLLVSQLTIEEEEDRVAEGREAEEREAEEEDKVAEKEVDEVAGDITDEVL